MCETNDQYGGRGGQNKYLFHPKSDFKGLRIGDDLCD